MALKELSDGGPAGTRLGQSTSDLVGFWGTSPVVRYAGSSAQGAVSTSGMALSTGGQYGFSTAAQGDALIALVNELRACLVAAGIFKGAS